MVQYQRPGVYTVPAHAPHSHAALFDRVWGMHSWGSSMIVSPICESRLTAAVRLLERVDEVSCGLWRVEYRPYRDGGLPNKSAMLTVDLGAVFLKKVGINAAEYAGRHHYNQTTFKVPLGCPYCAQKFVEYYLNREGKGEGGEEE